MVNLPMSSFFLLARRLKERISSRKLLRWERYCCGKKGELMFRGKLNFYKNCLEICKGLQIEMCYIYKRAR